ncbi:MAG TPA: S8 family peptidase [Elusimicrobiales bacterium]|nr:S8 family peptidase [Elusimicrobiales bacterium]
MNRFSGIVAGALLLLAAQAQASQKIVSFEASYRNGAMARSVEAIGGRVTRQFKLIDALVAVFPDNVKNASIYSLDGVTSVEEDLTIKWIESEPLSMNAVPLPTLGGALQMIRTGEGWNAPAVPAARPDTDPEIPWGVKRVNAAGAWNFTEGAGVKVAVIDTGVDFNHPDLKANYKGGYNTIITTAAPLDDHGHGTHVSGTIAAVRNATGVVGVAPRASLYGVKVLDKNGSGSYSNVMAGIEWATLNGMQVINMSLGGGGAMESMQKVIKAAYDAGVTIVCAAGNDSGPVNYPAKYPESIAVSASDSYDKLASFSSKGPEIAVIAPGVDIYSTKKGGGYRTMSGTSMACPHVAGLAALAIGAGANNPAAVRQSMTNSATLLPGLKPTDQGAGLVDAAKLGN